MTGHESDSGRRLRGGSGVAGPRHSSLFGPLGRRAFTRLMSWLGCPRCVARARQPSAWREFARMRCWPVLHCEVSDRDCAGRIGQRVRHVLVAALAVLCMPLAHGASAPSGGVSGRHRSMAVREARSQLRSTRSESEGTVLSTRSESEGTVSSAVSTPGRTVLLPRRRRARATWRATTPDDSWSTRSGSDATSPGSGWRFRTTATYAGDR